MLDWATLTLGRVTPTLGWATITLGWATPTPSWATPTPSWATPTLGWFELKTQSQSELDIGGRETCSFLQYLSKTNIILK